uniref:MIF4G domain-containing protein n=1 Tax=Strongyloides venezuelensis TaxID=75913 RepID=A0A0K0G0W0_STRVS
MFHVSNELRVIFKKYLETKDESILRMHLILLIRDVVKDDIENEYKSYISNQSKSKNNLKIENNEEINLMNNEKFYTHVNNVKNKKTFNTISNLTSTIAKETKNNFDKKNSQCAFNLDHSYNFLNFKEIDQILINICSSKLDIKKRKKAVEKLITLDALTIIHCEQFKIFMNSISNIFREKLLQESILKCLAWICNSEEFHLIYNCTVFILSEAQINFGWWSNPENNSIIVFHKLLHSLLINVPEIWKFFKQHKVENICYLFKNFYKLWSGNCIILFIYAHLDKNIGIWKRFLSTNIFWKIADMEEEKIFFDNLQLSEENLNINDFCLIVKSKQIEQNVVENMIKNYKCSIINVYRNFKISK